MRLELIIENEDGTELRVPLNEDVQFQTYYKDNGEIDYMDLELLKGIVVSFGKSDDEEKIYSPLDKFPLYEEQ